MKVWLPLTLALLFVLPANTQQKWQLVWSDEFNQQDGSAPDLTKWSYDEGVGSNGWGNNELEYYTKRSNNVVIHNGNLVITAIRES